MSHALSAGILSSEEKIRTRREERRREEEERERRREKREREEEREEEREREERERSECVSSFSLFERTRRGDELTDLTVVSIT